MSLAGAIIQLNADNQKLEAFLRTADNIQKDAFLALDDIRSNTENALDGFHGKYPDALQSNLHTASTALLNEGCKTILNTLASTHAGLGEQSEKYRAEILSKIERNDISAIDLMEKWLAEDYDNLPAALLDRLEREIIVETNSGNSKSYVAHCRTSIRHWTDRKDLTMEPGIPLPVSYVYRIDSGTMDFWSSAKKISDFGLRDLFLPVGLKTSISERIKQAFRLSSKEENGGPTKEPQFVKVDGYYISSIRLDGKRSSLSIELVADIAKRDSDHFEIIFDIGHILSTRSYQDVEESVNDYPVLHYLSGKETMALSGPAADLFQIPDIAEVSDLPKIRLCARMLFEKLKLLQSEGLIASKGHLQFLNANGCDIFTSKANKKIDYSALLKFIAKVAESFRPYVKILKEKTPVNGELILRQEVGIGNRKEYSIRVDKLKSCLSNTDAWSKQIIDILKL